MATDTTPSRNRVLLINPNSNRRTTDLLWACRAQSSTCKPPCTTIWMGRMAQLLWQ